MGTRNNMGPRVSGLNHSGLNHSGLSTIVAMQKNRSMSAHKVAATRPKKWIDR
jgi:hypothetical protein